MLKGRMFETVRGYSLSWLTVEEVDYSVNDSLKKRGLNVEQIRREG